MRIKDENGRIGVVTSERQDGYFVRPEDVPYKIGDQDGITGVANAILITATYWSRQPNGILHGLWFDSRLGDFRTARIIPDASQMGRKGGSSTSPAKQAASRLNGRKGGNPTKTKTKKQMKKRQLNIWNITQV